ncbi:hypothetical protein EW093_08340 [Thiospirochaeta perfilievii]|uniref:Uncharacterized protein n=1 Tax=Thiospirochaeta perfilievii TaxID=252967 RepID=A0A5C1Q9I9_9SPIO|nr:hypothetical protein [Thiospirochaeta perfilievii]QEN04715.1 hypothetical protein EW093_08340 [Thiospirochaeta perfilievii]
MFSYQLDFKINEGNMNSFLIGTKTLFEKIYQLAKMLGSVIDVEILIEHKLIEIESSKISYQLDIDIKYPIQNALGSNINKHQIDDWISKGFQILLSYNSVDECISSLNSLVEKLKLYNYLLYVKIPEKKLKRSLEDMEKLSILLFNDLVFYEM